MPRGEITFKILEILQNGAEATAQLLDIFTSDYFTSYKKMGRALRYGSPSFESKQYLKHSERQQFYSLLNQLKNQGFVEKKKSADKKSSIWTITEKGLKKSKFIKEKIFNKKHFDYKKESDDKIKVIIFDIPEKERYKRDWLRMVLRGLGFSLLQRSVWIGKNKIPEEFLRDLKQQRMLSYIQIFEINKKGTLTKMF